MLETPARRRRGPLADADLARVAADLEQGFTLPAEWYHDPAIYRLEWEAVFGASWQLVGLTTEVSQPGSYTVVQVDQLRSFVVARDEAGRLRAFSNVCPHRAATLCDGPGSGRTVQCGYHGWTWRLDGSLHRAPLMDEAADFDPAEFALREVAVDTWGPLIFLNPDPHAAPLAEYLGDLPQQVAALGVDMAGIARHCYSLVLDRVFACNWKVAVENGLECYHCAVAHPGFADTVDLNRWHIRMGGNCIVQGTTLRQPGGARKPRPTRLGDEVTQVALSEEGTDVALFHFIFPNQTVQVWPGPSGSFSLGRFIPMGPHHVRRWYARFWSADVPREVSEASWAFTMQVSGEDRAICEGVQVGLQSGGYARGRFQLQSPGLGEWGAQQMNRLLLRRLQQAVSE